MLEKTMREKRCNFRMKDIWMWKNEKYRWKTKIRSAAKTIRRKNETEIHSMINKYRESRLLLRPETGGLNRAVVL